MNWFWGSLFGSICLVILNSLTKKYPFEGYWIIVLSILSVITTWFYWYAFRHSDGFLRVWFIQSALVGSGAFAANYFLIKEPLKPETLFGIGLIIAGTVLLKWTG